MSLTVQEIIENTTSEIALKLGGISHLLQNYNSNGSQYRDRQDVAGLGVLIQEISDQASRLAHLMDVAGDMKCSLKVEFEEYETDALSAAIAVVQSRTKRK